ncbi:MAG: hypothetical protein NVS1B6_08760 [Steroidobacteraceae bacterium]
MLFGFIASAMAGFLLTAVPSWSGQKEIAGAPLMVLVSMWLASRMLTASSALWPATLIAHPLIRISYVLLTAAAVLRVFEPPTFGLNYRLVIIVSALCWTIAFALFVIVYAPILWGPRIAGKAG